MAILRYVPQSVITISKIMNISSESLVLADTLPTRLCFNQIVEGSLELRDSFMPGGNVYIEDRDYKVDYISGTIARTAQSRIPDYSKHILYGKKEFDHTRFPDDDLTNHKWFVWADYRTENGMPLAVPNDQSQYLTQTRKRLEAGGPFKIISYGDSITAGCDVSDQRLTFTHLYTDYLGRQFPSAQITHYDISIPGQSSREGLAWFDQKPEGRNSTPPLGMIPDPDLIIVGFGMNDHNKGSNKPEQTKSNLMELVELIRNRKGADVILFSTFRPHDDWYYSTHCIEKFADAIKQAAIESQCAYVNVYDTWKKVLERKDQSSLLANNINHPNYFGHWLYEQAFEAMKF
eukprot:TRINITY_DN419_c0_g1_i7.p1 TRINITY_DN419_c0_g1~~TRINITY_DN419_c0_g1_i7.p1  ORF type:complete len:347 (+),score=22.09 TRINITY_DN419_c0_g1_i7:279-1319(+)